MIVGAEQQFLVGDTSGGEHLLIGSFLSTSTHGAVFEDDGTTAYFYAVKQGQNMDVLDAMHIYNVDDVADKEVAVTGQILWNEDEDAVAMIINGYCHALFDFKQQVGFCRTAFPPPKNDQTELRELTDELVTQYFAA